jgi:hypothetical protein
MTKAKFMTKVLTYKSPPLWSSGQKLSSVQTTRDLSSSVQLHRIRVREYLVEVGWGDVGWIGLAQDRDRWRALVNSVLNLRVA